MNQSKTVCTVLIFNDLLTLYCSNCVRDEKISTDEWLKQPSAHPHEVDHQLCSARHRVFQSFNPRTLSGRWISSDHMITTLHWIDYSSHGLFLAIANWRFFFAACPSAFTAALCCFPTTPVCLESSMLSILIVLENSDSPPLQWTT